MMMFVKVWAKVFLFLAVAWTATFAFAPPAAAQTIDRGNVVGTIYDQDGKLPVTGAVVKLKNITTGAVYASQPTDARGFFRIEALLKGIYQFGIVTSGGDFNSNELVGVLTGETTKISISLNPYEPGVRSAMQEVLREQAAKEGESRVGRVIRFNPATKEAEVFVEKGVLQVDDRVRVTGVLTNFYQDVTKLSLEREAVKRLYAGQNGVVLVVKDAEPGDSVYLVCKRGVPPFFLTPCGIATVVAGAGLIIGTIIEITEKDDVSPCICPPIR
jgi:hypothetical protein